MERNCAIFSPSNMQLVFSLSRRGCFLERSLTYFAPCSNNPFLPYMKSCGMNSSQIVENDKVRCMYGVCRMTCKTIHRTPKNDKRLLWLAHVSMRLCRSTKLKSGSSYSFSVSACPVLHLGLPCENVQRLAVPPRSSFATEVHMTLLFLQACRLMANGQR